MKFVVATVLFFVSSAMPALSDETSAKDQYQNNKIQSKSAPDVNVCAVSADALVGCKPYKSGRDERHQKTKPTLPDESGVKVEK
jgi:hypothetical protein